MAQRTYESLRSARCFANDDFRSFGHRSRVLQTGYGYENGLDEPTTLLHRNFVAMETEELLRSHAVDGAVLMGGCDKTRPD